MKTESVMTHLLSFSLDQLFSLRLTYKTLLIYHVTFILTFAENELNEVVYKLFIHSPHSHWVEKSLVRSDC